MINPVNLSSVSHTSNAVAFRINTPDSLPKKVALPVILSLGNQTKIVGDRAYAACYAACVAAVAAATLSPAGIVLCFNGCLPLVAVPPLSC